MKRKIALALAAVMAVAMIVPMNLFASTTASVSTGGFLSKYAAGTLIPDGQLQLGPSVSLIDLSGSIDNLAWNKSGNGGNVYSSVLANNGVGSTLLVKFSMPDYQISAQRAFRVSVTGGYLAYYQSPVNALTDVGSIFTGSPTQNNNWPDAAYIVNKNTQNMYDSLGNKLPAYQATFGDELIGTSESLASFGTDTQLGNVRFAPFFAAVNYGAQYVAGAGAPSGSSAGYAQNLITDDLYNNTMAAIYSAYAVFMSAYPTTWSAAYTPYAAAVAAGTPITTTMMTSYINAAITAAAGIMGTSLASQAMFKAEMTAAVYDPAFLAGTAGLNNIANWMTAAINAYGQTLNNQYAIMVVTPTDVLAVMNAISTDPETAAFTSWSANAAPLLGATVVGQNGSLLNGTTFASNAPTTTLTDAIGSTTAITNPFADYVGAPGAYTPYWKGSAAGTVYGAEYMMTVTGSQTFTINYYGNIDSGAAMMVPPVVVSDGTPLVANIYENGANTVSNGQVNFSTSTPGIGVQPSIGPNSSNGKYSLSLDTVTLTEKQINALANGGSFYIDAPMGYHFVGLNPNGTVYGTGVDATGTGYTPLGSDGNKLAVGPLTVGIPSAYSDIFMNVELDYMAGYNLTNFTVNAAPTSYDIYNANGTGKAYTTGQIGGGQTLSKTMPIYDPSDFENGVQVKWPLTVTGWYTGSTTTSTFNIPYTPLTAPEAVSSYYLNDSTTVGPASRIYFSVENLQKYAQNNLNGAITISGLMVAPNDLTNTAYGQNLSIYVNNSSWDVANWYTIGSTNANLGLIQIGFPANVIPTTLTIGQRQNWQLTYSVTSQFGTDTSTLGAPANSWSGWSNMGDMQTSQTNLSLLNTPASSSATTTIEATLQENIAEAWWTDHDTTFSLTDANGNPITGVKFSSVKVTTNKLANNIAYTTAGSINGDTAKSFLGRYITAGTANVNFNVAGAPQDTAFTVYNLNRADVVTPANIVIDFTLSAQADFAGAVYLHVQNDGLNQMYGANYANVTTIKNGNSTPGTLADGSADPTTIEVANFTPVVKVIQSTQNVQIGYQSFGVQNIELQEGATGLIQANNVTGNNQITLALGEYGNGNLTPYMYFAPVNSSNLQIDPNATPTTASGLKISNFGTMPNSLSGNQNIIAMTVSSKSTNAPADIVLSNLVVNISRDVPQGNYDLIVGGSALTNNSANGVGYAVRHGISAADDLSVGLDVFPVAGMLSANYITVATQGANIPFTANVMVQASSDTATVNANGVTTSYPLGCQAIIDANGNMMVPIRFVSTALGVDPNSIYWDSISQTCTVYTTEKTFTFQVNSPTYTINGQSFTLLDANGNPIMPTLTLSSDGTARMFLPFRALGKAFGLPVTWDPTTSTAIYNPTQDQINALGVDDSAVVSQ